MQVVSTRLVLAGLMASLWVGWAIWANIPHYYDLQEMQRTVAAAMGPNNVDIQPASAGFPFAFMRYDYSNSKRLTVHDTEASAVLPNVLFSIVGAVGAALLIARTRRISLGGLALLCCLLLPAIIQSFLLNGLHSSVIAYLYLTPLMILLVVVASESVRQQKGENQVTHLGREVDRFYTCESLVAKG